MLLLKLKVEKKAIDNFTPGISSWIPHSHFKASLPCAAHLAGNIPTLECEVHLNGFEAPHNKFTVHIDPSVMPAAGIYNQIISPSFSFALPCSICECVPYC